MSSERVMAVFAHPDDESLFAGGILAACAAGGVETSVLSLTRGERGEVVGSGDSDGADLGATRSGELAEACRVLGVARAECLHYPDGELWWLPEADAASDLAARIDEWSPRALITFAGDGLYWHRDHRAVHSLVLAAGDLLTGRGAEVPALHGVTWPEWLAPRLVQAMAARALPTDLWGLSPDAFGSPAESITSSLDVRHHVATKVRALRCHRSQLHPGHLLHELPDDLAEEFLGHEYLVALSPGSPRESWLAEVLGGRPPAEAGAWAPGVA